MDPQTALDLDSGRWAQHNPSTCPCRGRGWMLSDYDTFHKCPLHGQGVPHPEDEVEDFDYEGHHLQVFRNAYRVFAVMAKENGFRGSWTEFRRQCRARFNGKATPELWVTAAEEIATKLCCDAADAAARREGYSCDLERRWAEDAADERQGHLFH